jgi:ferredoxin
MLDLEGRASGAMARWGPGVRPNPLTEDLAERVGHEKGAPVSDRNQLVLRVNPITCAGHGLCAELLPELVTLDDWGYPMPITAEVPPGLEQHAQRAAQSCPTLAIQLERQRHRRA